MLITQLRRDAVSQRATYPLTPTRTSPTVVSLEERHFYSGMTPGYLAGQYTAADITSDVQAIAQRAGAR